jgi:aminoglycoside phosphotransferase (APT) family kinase protein
MTDQPSPPRAQGQRLGWDDLPPHIRSRIEAWLEEPVASAHSMPGGFSPGLAARLETRSGRRVFAKAVCSVPNDEAPRIHRREIEVASRLPAGAPVARLLWSHAEDDGDGWVVLVFEEVAGHPPAQPWVPAEFDRVVSALNELTADLTPSPVPEDEIGDVLGWGVLSGRHWIGLEVDEVPHPDPWVTRHLDRLIALEGRIHDVLEGETLLHLDLRGDNMLLTGDGVVIVDWPHARVGPPWLDGAFFAPSVAMEGGPGPEDLARRLDAMRAADPEHLTVGIAAVAGFFTHLGGLPPVPGLPGLRAFQEAQGAVARRWLAQRTGWT